MREPKLGASELLKLKELFCDSEAVNLYINRNEVSVAELLKGLCDKKYDINPIIRMKDIVNIYRNENLFKNCNDLRRQISKALFSKGLICLDDVCHELEYTCECGKKYTIKREEYNIYPQGHSKYNEYHKRLENLCFVCHMGKDMKRKICPDIMEMLYKRFVCYERADLFDRIRSAIQNYYDKPESNAETKKSFKEIQTMLSNNDLKGWLDTYIEDL